MERILVLGSSGSGKSTVAQRLGRALALDVIHLDSYYWKPNWIATPPDEWERVLDGLLQRERWVMDGNYPQSLGRRIDRADSVVFLDVNRLVCLARCVKRFLQHRGRNRPELATGCYEKIDCDFLKWIWHYPSDVEPVVGQTLRENVVAKEIFWLRSNAEVENLLQCLKENNGQRNTRPWN